ncbi:MAG: hypothetical protein HRU41_39170 [Saprospiraceae bacterium]|nr:hypothetical protein [Saprospiraceae bacterium]
MEIQLDTQKDIKRLIAMADLEQALQHYLKATEPEALLNLHNQAVGLMAQFKQFKQDSQLNVVDYDDLARTRNRINMTLLALTDELPSEEVLLEAEKKKPGIRESRLKRIVLRFMIISKVFVLGLLLFLWDTGGFSVDQFIGTASLLIPLFTAYTVLMVRDSAKNRYVHIQSQETEMLVTHHFKNMVYFWMFVYTFAISLVLILKPAGALAYNQMSATLTLVEIGIGVYVGEVVFALFKKPSK